MTYQLAKAAHGQLSVSTHSTSHQEPGQHKLINEIKVYYSCTLEVRRLFSMSVQSDEKATNITMKKGEFYDERLSS